MASQRTVDDILAELRSLLDEQNEEALEDGRDLLPALNRAQSYAYNILSRRYVDPILTYSTITLTGNQQEYDIPEDAFEDRIVKVEIEGNQGYFFECQRLSYKDITAWETESKIPYPQYHAIVGRHIRFVSPPNGTYNARVWYVQDPEKLVKQQGRVTTINTANNYILVDSVGSSITTETDNLESYVNVIDGQTGEIKGTLQVQNYTTNKITFKTTPSRTTVLNKTVTGDLSSISIEADDYICLVMGTCVLYFQDAISNFILQYAAFQMEAKLGTATGTEAQLVEKFEKQLERQWSGRETSLRVAKRNRIFSPPYRRWRGIRTGGN